MARKRLTFLGIFCVLRSQSGGTSTIRILTHQCHLRPSESSPNNIITTVNSINKQIRIRNLSNLQNGWIDLLQWQQQERP